MTRQGTANIGLTYEDDKSKTFSYDNDIKNNMVTIDSEIGSTKNRLTDIENNTESPQFSPLLDQDSSIFSTGSGSDELGVAVDLSERIVKGQVSVGVKGLTLINNSINAESIQTTTYAAGHLSKIRPEARKLEQNSKYFTYVKYAGVEGTNNTVSGEVRVTSPETITLVDAVSGEGYKIYERTGNTILIDNLTFYGPSVDEGSGRIADWEDFIFIDMTALGIEDYTEEQMLELARMGYWEGTKSTVCALRLKSINDNLLDESVLQDSTSVGRVTGSFTGEKIRLDNSSNTSTRAEARVRVNLINGVTYIAQKYNEIIDTGTGIGSTFGITDLNSTLNLVTPTYNTSFTWNLPTGTYEYVDVTDFGSLQQVEYNVKLELSSASTAYNRYQESIQYINAIDGNGDVMELSSLPNGIKDEVSDGKLYKRTEKYVLQTSDITGISVAFTDVDLVTLSYNNISNHILNSVGDSSPNRGITSITNRTVPLEGIPIDNINSIWRHYFNVANWVIIVPKGYYVDLAAAQADLAGTTLIYQLATPETIKINTNPLTCCPKGITTIEPLMYKKFSYNNGISWTIPVSEIEEIKKISTGEIITDYTLSSDGLLLTISNASNGEEYTIKAHIRREESTIPTTVMSYPTNINAANKRNTDAINELSKIVSELLVKQ